jgi:phycocyanobilin lyase beta subunit
VSQANAAALQTKLEAIEQAATRQQLANASAQLVALMPQLSEEPPLQAQAIDCCIDLLKANNPAAALQALRGLIGCGSAAVEPLLNSLDERNYGARAWTVRALSAIQDPRGLEVLQRAVANDIGPSVRQAAAYGLGRLQGHDENLLRPCMNSLELACSDSEWSVRYAAVAALEQRLQQGLPSDLAPQARALLRHRSQQEMDDTLVVRLRALLALERLAA